MCVCVDICTYVCMCMYVGPRVPGIAILTVTRKPPLGSGKRSKAHTRLWVFLISTRSNGIGGALHVPSSTSITCHQDDVITAQGPKALASILFKLIFLNIRKDIDKTL